MSHETISNWIARAKMAPETSSYAGGVKVIRRADAHKGHNLIEAIAEKLKPWLTKTFENAHDRNGVLVSPAAISAIALDTAQDIVNQSEDE